MSEKTGTKDAKAEKQGDLPIHPYIGGTTRNLIGNVIRNGGVSAAKETSSTRALPRESEWSQTSSAERADPWHD